MVFIDYPWPSCDQVMKFFYKKMQLRNQFKLGGLAKYPLIENFLMSCVYVCQK